MVDPASVSVSNPDLLVQILQLNSILKQLSEGMTHLVTGGMAAHAIEWLKGRGWFSRHWNQLEGEGKAFWSAVIAAASGAGIVLTFAHPGNGHYIIDLDHLTPETGSLFVWSFLQNWLWQQGWYMKVIRPQPVTGPAPSQQPTVPVTVTPA